MDSFIEGDFCFIKEMNVGMSILMALICEIVIKI